MATWVRYEGQRHPVDGYERSLPQAPANPLQQIDVVLPSTLDHAYIWTGTPWTPIAQYHFSAGQPQSVPDSHATWLLGHPCYIFTQTSTPAQPDARVVR